MAEKQKPTWADYTVTAISPALIMGLVGSLVFFLVEILYAGKYESRLLWTLFFFVAGIVLVSRISIQVDAKRAAGYGLGLAVVSWIALFAFIDYPKNSRMSDFAGLINLVLMAVIWWSAHKLTWDCTFIDEKREASGKGLLAAAGFERRPETAGQVREDELRQVEVVPDEEMSLWKRWNRFRDRRRKRPHTPGLTVVWFSLAALPIFGLGQSLIPGGDGSRRSFTFKLAACYVGCSLGLLLTTSFLGLRRYLRQRKLSMPKAMTGVWLGMGAALVIGFVFVGALLPRPYSETPIWGLNKLGSSDRKSSKNAILKDSAGKGEGQAGNQTKAGDGSSTAKGGKPGGNGKNGEAKQGGGDKKDGDGGNDKSGKKGDSEGKGENKDSDGKSKSGDSQQENKGEDNKEKGEDASSAADANRRFPDTKLGNIAERVATFLKWIVFILLALMVLAFIFRGALKYLANFMPWARNWLAALQAWWESLWGKRGGVAESTTTEEKKSAHRPFTTFMNPFANGNADERAIEELIEYSFTALEAWAADRNHPRQPEETALEFTARLSTMFNSLESEPHKLAILVVRLAYANGTLPGNARETLEHFWDHMSGTMPAVSGVE